MSQVQEKKMTREIEYMFQTLQREWERSGKTVITRRMGQDEYDMFVKYYAGQMRYYDATQNESESESIRVMLSSMKEMSILSRIAKKICRKVSLNSSKKKGYFDIELDKEERRFLEEIIGEE